MAYIDLAIISKRLFINRHCYNCFILYSTDVTS